MSLMLDVCLQLTHTGFAVASRCCLIFERSRGSWNRILCLYLNVRGQDGTKKCKKSGKVQIGSLRTLKGRLVPPGPPLFFHFSARGTSGPPWSPLRKALDTDCDQVIKSLVGLSSSHTPPLFLLFQLKYETAPHCFCKPFSFFPPLKIARTLLGATFIKPPDNAPLPHFFFFLNFFNKHPTPNHFITEPLFHRHSFFRVVWVLYYSPPTSGRISRNLNTK